MTRSFPDYPVDIYELQNREGTRFVYVFGRNREDITYILRHGLKMRFNFAAKHNLSGFQRNGYKWGINNPLHPAWGMLRRIVDVIPEGYLVTTERLILTCITEYPDYIERTVSFPVRANKISRL